MSTKHFFERLTIGLIFIMLITSISGIKAQSIRDVKIKIDAANITLEQTLRLLEQKTDFNFSYNKDSLPLDKKVQLIDKEESLYNVLFSLAKNFGLTFNRIAGQIVVKKTIGNESFYVKDWGYENE
jgi:TonB-dependent starch-binding outer membrane protein SusC